MGIFSKKEKRNAGLVGPTSDFVTWFTGLFGSSQSISGENVTADTATSFSAVWACVQVRAEALAQLPVGIFERTDSGKSNRSDHYLYYLLHNEPNSLMTSFTFHKTMQTILDLYGNAYAKIERDSSKVKITGFTIIHPELVTPKISEDGLLVYVVREAVTGKTETIQAYNMIHLVGFSKDGIIGLSPIQAHKESVGMALATQKFGAKFYANGATLGGVIEYPNKLTNEAKQRLAESWRKKYEGTDNSFRTAVLEEGAKYTQIGIKPVDAQYIEMMRFTVEETARIYRVPLHLIGDLTRSTNNNIEEQGISFVRDTMTPIVKVWEQEWNRKIFSANEKGRLYTEYNMNGLLRGNATARASFYMTMVQNGLMSANEVRSLENMNDYEGGEKYMKPLNLGYVGEKEEPIKTQESPKTTEQ